MLCHVTYCKTVLYSTVCAGRGTSWKTQQTPELVTLSFRFLKINIDPDDPGTRVSTYDAAQAPVMVVMDGSRAFIVVP